MTSEQLISRKRMKWLRLCLVIWVFFAGYAAMKAGVLSRHQAAWSDWSLVVFVATFFAGAFYLIGVMWLNMRAPSIRRSIAAADGPAPQYLPVGFMKRANEHILFSSDTLCALPTVQTRTFGMFGGIGAADSTSKVVVGDRQQGFLTISNQRVVASARGDVREWTLAQITSAFAPNPSQLTMHIANVGTAEFTWKLPYARQAEGALRNAMSGEWS